MCETDAKNTAGNVAGNKLNTEYNEKYLEIASSLRESNLSKTEQTEVCNDVLGILLSGQNEGKPVEEVIGVDAAAFSDEIIKAFSKVERTNENRGPNIPFLPSFRKSKVLSFYHLGAWLLAAYIALTATVVEYNTVRPVFYIIIVFNGFLYPLYLNGKPPEPSSTELKRLILSATAALGVILTAWLINYSIVNI
ncbi:DUF1048 domain-containing protein [Dethiobacter alkaliphilus]|uniref:Uncharacterized protein n=1 Tax=Dethiobacter alkaliphilus AHT 1 TaxID=555088 RepID=C0GD84_DETAL|nr:DUF1048 domain-containing protein [Dethiobacter alkaliphilus]EEG78605.1 hypothetical protein DealDRAFT_0535 [Dethiobacter alkaliphilus AHT 1]